MINVLFCMTYVKPKYASSVFASRTIFANSLAVKEDRERTLVLITLSCGSDVPVDRFTVNWFKFFFNTTYDNSKIAGI